MTTDDRFERDLGEWLEATAPMRGPVGLHDGAMERARRARQRPGWLVTVMSERFGTSTRIQVSPRTAYLLTALALVVATIVAVALIGAVRTPPSLGGNGAIVYSWQGSNRSGNGSAKINADGTDGGPVRAFCPTFSADGTLMVATGFGGPPGSAILDQVEGVLLEPVDGSRSSHLAIEFVWHGIGFRSWDLSPDGTRLAWMKPGPYATTPPLADGSTQGMETGTEIWISPVDGSPATLLMPAPEATYASYWQPLWSPDGRSIAFVAWESDVVNGVFEDRRVSIVVVRADGSDLRRIPIRPLVDFDLAWSPDSRHLAFLGVPDGATAETSGDLFVISVDGTNERNLTNSSPFEHQPAWAPNGRAIAFLTDDENQESRLAMIPMDGARPSGPVTFGPKSGGAFVWSPNGELLLHAPSTIGQPASSGVEPRRVTELRTIDRAFRNAPSAPLATIDGTLICRPAWQRVE